jgi:Lysine biosynthesis enzyme LysX
MKIELLYDMPRLEEKLMIEALRASGVDVVLTNVDTRPLVIGEAESDLSLVRVVSMQKALYSATIRESSGTRAMNSSLTLMLCGDKILTLSKINSVGLRVPKTTVMLSPEPAELVFRQFPKPFVDKPPVGSWGRMVTLVRDLATWRSIVEHRSMMQSQQLRTHVIQEYVEGLGRDIRAIVIGSEFVGAVHRISSGDEWRTNVALGGKTAPLKADGEFVEMSLKAAEAVKGDFISVDILEDREGRLYLNEVNGVPEFKGFMEATGINVGELFVKYALRVAKR